LLRKSPLPGLFPLLFLHTSSTPLLLRSGSTLPFPQDFLLSGQSLSWDLPSAALLKADPVRRAASYPCGHCLHCPVHDSGPLYRSHPHIASPGSLPLAAALPVFRTSQKTPDVHGLFLPSTACLDLS